MPIVKGFRRFHSNIVSSKQVVTEISNLVAGSNVQQSGKSSAAPLTSKRSIRKRVTSADRRVMLESFVNEYRAMNLGKFPSPTSAHKEVGGSYYLIRKMLQEMEYNYKISSAERKLVKENKTQIKCDDTISKKIAIKSSGSQKVSSSQTTIDQQLCEDPRLEPASNFDTIFELKEGLQPSTSNSDTGSNNTGSNNISRDDTHNIATKSHDTRNQCHEKPDHYLKDGSPSEDNFAFEDSESKVEKQHDGISNNILRDMREPQKEDDLRGKPSFWGNLKSLATGFINIWKK